MENLKATELRLGLPGTEEEAAPPPSTPRAGSKRALAGEPDQAKIKPAAAAKAQVVGWPPVRSYRKSCLQPTTTTTKSKPPPAAAAAETQQKEDVAGAGGLFVKVSMDGAPYLRKIDLKVYKGYRELREALEAMFLCFSGGAAADAAVNPSDFAVTYEDKDGDLMLVGDVPFEMFISTCKRLRIMKGSEARGLGATRG
ncbi:auxin-responsive protein IAA31 [Oryza sativa Japonica Group]|jgi:auxin-responsive protein IAA|uniref:Auxin-responsive protein IAA31 n=4 Tax=Oryza TaxID=4527 RepID=IAA31_ORYSJ|eukprot:NP_001067210.1 Os12g0601400 [Oryza sativa Japonica Group]